MKPVAVAVRNAFEWRQDRLMALEMRFPDIGSPMVERLGFLRYTGEPCIGDPELLAGSSESGHNV